MSGNQSLTFGELSQMSQEDQAIYYASRESDAEVVDLEMLDTAILGVASFTDILCKLWKFILGVAKAVVDGVVGLLKDVSSAVFEVLGELFDGASGLFDNLLSSPLGWLLLAVGGYMAYSIFIKDDDGKKDEAKEVAKTYYTGGLL